MKKTQSTNANQWHGLILSSFPSGIPMKEALLPYMSSQPNLNIDDRSPLTRPDLESYFQRF